MGKKTKTPATPNYALMESAQNSQARTDQAQANLMNRPTQSNQYGTQSWTQNADGSWMQKNQLNAPQQQIFDTQQANQQQLANTAGGMLGGFDTSQIDFSGAPGMPQVGQYNQQATDLYNQLAQPGLDRENDAQRARLAAMGMSEFGSRAGTNMNQQIADRTSRSGMMGAQAGITQGNQMFNQGMDMRQQGVGEILNQRQANLGQLQGMFGLGESMGVPQYPYAQPVGAMPTMDLTGAMKNQYSANLNTSNAANADATRNQDALKTAATIAAIAF